MIVVLQAGKLAVERGWAMNVGTSLKLILNNWEPKRAGLIAYYMVMNTFYVGVLLARISLFFFFALFQHHWFVHFCTFFVPFNHFHLLIAWESAHHKQYGMVHGISCICPKRRTCERFLNKHGTLHCFDLGHSVCSLGQN